MAAPLGEGIVRRGRKRPRTLDLSEDQRKEVANRVCDFYERDIQAHAPDRDRRLQLYAKYRQWQGNDTGWPWPGASDFTMPDMMEASARMQDTLHNAVMSSRPAVVSRAMSEQDRDKQEAIDALHDAQLFVEQPGERMLEHAVESFVNDPAVTIFTPWVRESRESVDIRTFDPIPDDVVPVRYFNDILLRQINVESARQVEGSEGWDWDITFPDEEPATAKFYTKDDDDMVEVVIRRTPIVFDGPAPRVLDYDDVIVPPGVANLDIPGPSNPGGAPHVILRDYPTRDEIDRLRRSKRYDYITKEDIEDLEAQARTRSHTERKQQADAFEGVEDDETLDRPQGTLTRLTCFDTYATTEDGPTQDVVFVVILEGKKLCRAVLLTEEYPGRKPERPLAEASFLPVGGRRAGISLLEMMEGVHDVLKEAFDQMIDNGTLTNLPWGTYRASSSLKPETLRPGPGDMIPTNDPKNDIQMQSFGNAGQAFWMNILAIIRQMSERLTLQGDLQAGRVPTGKASALRTSSGINTILAQGESRPERILRRFFMALTRMYRQMHRLNRYFLPEEKKFLAAGEVLKPGENPWITLASTDVDVDLEFDFHANVQNSSRDAVQQGLQQFAGIAVSDLLVQMGIMRPDNAYRLVRDIGKSMGQEVDEYLTPPTPQADRAQLLAEEAVLLIMDDIFPDGVPFPNATDHLAQLQAITEMDEFGALEPQQVVLLRTWMQQVAQQAQQEQQLAAQAAAAGPVGQIPGQGRGGGNGAVAPPDQSPTPVSDNELLDETLPTAGGGSGVV